MSDKKTLERLDDSEFKRVLVVVAHPDDAEYGTSAAVAQWTSQGIEVGYLILSAGEHGMDSVSPDKAGLIRAKEQRVACEKVGVEHLTILDFPDGAIEYGLPLRAAIAKEIRAFKPDVLVSGRGDLWVPWGIDHSDHRAVGLAAIDAVRDAGNRWLYPEQKLEPWEATRVLNFGVTPTHFVEVSEDNVNRGAQSLDAHETYFAELPEHPDSNELVFGMLSGFGKLAEVPYAMGFAIAQ